MLVVNNLLLILYKAANCNVIILSYMVVEDYPFER